MKFRIPSRFFAYRYSAFVRLYPLLYSLALNREKQLLPSAASSARVHFMYQAYCGDADLLLISIRSLIEGLGHRRKDVTVSVLNDKRNPVPEETLKQLQALVGPEHFTTFKTRFAHRDFFRFYNLYEAFYTFQKAAIHDQSYVVKIDSDIVWTNPVPFMEALNGSHDLLGKECTNFKFLTGFTFTQGGVYALRAGFLRRAIHPLPHPSDFAASRQNLPHYIEWASHEDSRFFQFFSKHRPSLAYLPIYPDRPDRFKPNEHWALHFEGSECKKQMRTLAANFSGNWQSFLPK